MHSMPLPKTKVGAAEKQGSDVKVHVLKADLLADEFILHNFGNVSFT